MTFRPLLAAEAKTADIRFPVLASPKIDGIRCLIRDGVPVTRSLKPIPNTFIRTNLANAVQGWPSLNYCDGEIVCPGQFNDTASGVMAREGKPEFVFHVFDTCEESRAGQSFRLRWLQKMDSLQGEEIHKLSGIKLVTQTPINNTEELEAYYQQALQDGHEGVMLRDPLGRYKHGRSTAKEGILLKLKPFADAEAVILRVDELQHNQNAAETNALGLTERSTAASGKVGGGTMGRLLVKAVTGPFCGKSFFIGTGFDNEMRNQIWASPQKFLGKKLTFKYQAHGSVDLPRIPVFVRWRED